MCHNLPKIQQVECQLVQKYLSGTYYLWYYFLKRVLEWFEVPAFLCYWTKYEHVRVVDL